MKQRVVVQAILKQGDKVLLIRRSQGRPGLIGKFELPGGTINNGEQPDDALRRHIANGVGVNVEHDGLKLQDVLSITSREEGDIQHIFIIYLYDRGIDSSLIKLGASYDSYMELARDSINNVQLRDSARLILGLNNIDKEQASNSSDEVKTTTKDIATIIYSDGGSRGNPGPSSSAFVIYDSNQNIIDQGGEYIGVTNSNQAEYRGVLLGLERAKQLDIRDIEFRIDSMLVVNQLKGLYTIKNKELLPINEKIRALIGGFNSVKFTHVPREMNRVADSLVNKFLDEHTDN